MIEDIGTSHEPHGRSAASEESKDMGPDDSVDPLVCVPARAVDFTYISKEEAFELCQLLAGVERSLTTAGRLRHAASVSEMFETLEERIFGPAPPFRGGGPGGPSSTRL